MYDPKETRPGGVILDHGSALLELAIEDATVNPFSHAALVGDGCLYEAVQHIQAADLDKYAETGWYFDVANAVSHEVHTVLLAAKSKLGQRYGYHELFEDFERYVLRLPEVQPINPDDLVCSGYVVWCWLTAGRVLTYNPRPSPASLSYSPMLLGKRPWHPA